jgi:ferritin-like metal-binding protein YciE
MDGSHNGMGKKPRQILDPYSPEGKAIFDLFLAELKKIYWIENSKIKVIEQLINRVDSLNVIVEIEDIQELARRKLRSLEIIFEKTGIPVATEISEPVKNIYLEVERKLAAASGAIARDAAIILVMQQTEHYEIATYTMMISLARITGKEEIAEILYDILNNEKEAQASLVELGETFLINE